MSLKFPTATLRANAELVSSWPFYFKIPAAPNDAFTAIWRQICAFIKVWKPLVTETKTRWFPGVYRSVNWNHTHGLVEFLALRSMYPIIIVPLCWVMSVKMTQYTPLNAATLRSIGLLFPLSRSTASLLRHNITDVQNIAQCWKRLPAVLTCALNDESSPQLQYSAQWTVIL